MILVNTPSEGMRLSRDMAGGLGFVHKAEDRFPPLDLLWWIARLEQAGWPVELADGSVKAFNVGDLLTHMAADGTDAVVCEVNLPTFEDRRRVPPDAARATGARASSRRPSSPMRCSSTAC